MVSKEDEHFMIWWEANRKRKKRLGWILFAGLPLGAALASAMLISIYSGWNVSSNILRQGGNLPATIIIGILATVVFVVLISARHKWDMNERHYRELLIKKEKQTD
jgi:hypothetical protein